MDNAIRFKKSRLERAAYLISFALACYWITVLDGAILIRVFLCIALLLLSYLLIFKHPDSEFLFVCPFKLTTTGLVALSRAPDDPGEYRLKLLQRLPWCMRIELISPLGKTRLLVWKDSLSKDNWRRFRRHLNELTPEQ
jgi:hypothetical protein